MDELLERYRRMLITGRKTDQETVTTHLQSFLRIPGLQINFIAALGALDARAALGALADRAALAARADRAALAARADRDALAARADRDALDDRDALAARFFKFDIWYEASFVFASNKDDAQRWMSFFDACEAGCFSLIKIRKEFFVIEFPTALQFDEQHRFHSISAPALEWLGEKFFYWHGVEVPERAIVNINSYSAKEILKERNIEVKRALMSLYGWQKILPEVKSIIIDEHLDPIIGRLHEFVSDGMTYHVVECHDPANPFKKAGEKPFNTAIGTQTNLRSVVTSLKNSYPLFRDLSDEEFVRIQTQRT